MNVLKCYNPEEEHAQFQNKDVVYGFERYFDQSQDIVPCLGRSLPKDCYHIQVKLSKAAMVGTDYLLLTGALLNSLVFGLLWLKRNKKTENSTGKIRLGKFDFLYEKQILVLEGKEVTLTAKENQVLHILAKTPNQTVSRDHLQESVWGSEGLIAVSYTHLTLPTTSRV